MAAGYKSIPVSLTPVELVNCIRKFREDNGRFILQHGQVKDAARRLRSAKALSLDFNQSLL
jgi:hypothetical protein